MILLHGYYGERNAGDDAFATICAERLARPAGPVQVMAAELPESARPHATPLLMRRRWKGLADRIERHRTRTLLQGGARVILGGGSLLRDSSGIADVRRLLDMARGTGHAALGISIGPWRDANAEAGCAELLPRFDFVGVRDAASLDRCRAIAPSARVELTFDLAPLLVPESAPVPRSVQSLGVALCGPMITSAQFEQLAAMLASWLGAAPEREVVLLPFNVHPRKGDIPLHDRLAAHLRAVGKVTLEGYRGDPRATWRRIAELSGIVAMRLHAGIFAYGSQTPTLLLPYEEKCREWASMIGQPADFVQSVEQVTTVVLERLLTEAPQAALPLTSARAAAARNFEAIGA